MRQVRATIGHRSRGAGAGVGCPVVGAEGELSAWEPTASTQPGGRVMASGGGRVNAAVVQAAPVAFDVEATLAEVERLRAECAMRGALTGAGMSSLMPLGRGLGAPASYPRRGGRMGQLVEFPLEDGGSVLVEVHAGAAGPVTRGLGTRNGVTEQAQHTFEQAVARVQPAAQVLVRRLRALADAPEEIGVEFGLELSAEAGAFIAAASSTANFKVTLMWRRPNSAPPVAGSQEENR
jgi:hypothetical protein